MERKIVEQLAAGWSVKKVARSLHVGRERVRRLREQAKEYGYLDEAGGRGRVALPLYPEALFPDPKDGRALQVSDAHKKLASKHEWIRERLSTGWHLVTVFEELPADIKDDIGRSSFYRYVDRHRLNRLGERSRRRVVPEIIHAPGEALLLDWGKLRDVIDTGTGRKRTLWMFAGVLGYSRFLLVRLVWRIDVETTLEALQSMFRELRGVPKKMTTDNPKCIALEASPYEALLNPAAERFAGHYGMFIEALPPRDPEKKGKIERPIPYLRRLYEAHGDAWHGIEESQAYMERKLAIANERKHGTTMRKPREVFEVEESKALKSLPAVAYELEQYHEGTVRKADGHVRFANKYYSVDEEYIGKEVIVLGSSKQVTIYYKGKLLEVHPRITDPNVSKSTKPHHLKPWERAMQDGSVYRRQARKLGSSVEEMIVELLKKGHGFVDTRKIWGILSLEKSYEASQVDAACRRALEIESLSFRTVKTILQTEEIATYKRVKEAERRECAPVGRRDKKDYEFVRPLSVYKEQLELLQ